MKTYLVVLSLLTLAIAAAPAASADQSYCGPNSGLCCQAGDDPAGDAFIRGCMVFDHAYGATFDVIDCVLNGNC